MLKENSLQNLHKKEEEIRKEKGDKAW